MNFLSEISRLTILGKNYCILLHVVAEFQRLFNLNKILAKSMPAYQIIWHVVGRPVLGKLSFMYTVNF